jgi:hypothetical protein
VLLREPVRDVAEVRGGALGRVALGPDVAGRLQTVCDVSVNPERQRHARRPRSPLPLALGRDVRGRGEVAQRVAVEVGAQQLYGLHCSRGSPSSSLKAKGLDPGPRQCDERVRKEAESRGVPPLPPAAGDGLVGVDPDFIAELGALESSEEV